MHRALVPLEILAIVVIAIAPIPDPLNYALPLMIAGTVFKWVRRRSWDDVWHGGRDQAGIGALAGAAALGLGLALGTPVVELLSNRAVEWSTHPMVRGSWMQVAVMIAYVAASATAAELALRGWIVERVLELSPGPPVLPILVGALAEGIVTPGGVGVRAGAMIFGAGLGWMYVAGGRSVTGPVCARVVFSAGALVLQGLMLIG